MRTLKVFVLEDEIGGYPRNQIEQALSAHKLTIAKSCPEAISLFKGGYDLILLDHDMEGRYEYKEEHPNTGYQFLKWMLPRFKQGGAEVWVHTQNPTGRERMLKLFGDYKWTNVQAEPFGTRFVDALKKIGGGAPCA